MKSLKKIVITCAVVILILLMMLLSVLGGSPSLGGGGGDVSGSSNLSAAVENYRQYVTEVAKEEKMEQYVDLILAVMQVESGGLGNDPMQSSEGPFNKKYAQIPNGITDPVYSIQCGVKELKDCLKRADVKDKNDLDHIRVALGGYNFGNGFIEWLKTNYQGKWSLVAATEFSKMMAKKMGWSSYGDPPYADKVMSYYGSIDFITGKGDLISPLSNGVVTSPYGTRALGGFHFGLDLSQSYGSPIYAPIDAVVYKVSNICPPNGGYYGNMCPYGEYEGGGNYVMLQALYKGKQYYIFMCHMASTNVHPGQQVKKGQRIGSQGNSGNSTGTHVHLEIHEGTPRIAVMQGIIDPETLIKLNGGK